MKVDNKVGWKEPFRTPSPCTQKNPSESRNKSRPDSKHKKDRNCPPEKRGRGKGSENKGKVGVRNHYWR